MFLQINMFTFFAIFNLIFISNAKHILILQTTFSQSYSILFEAIGITLASEHNVTLINRHYLSTKHPNITHIHMEEQRTEIVNKSIINIFEISLQQDDTSDLAINGMLTDREEYIEELMNSPVVAYLFKTKSLYDVLIMPTSISEAYFRFAHVLNVPLVQVATSHPMPWQNEAIGNPNYLSTDNSLLLEPPPGNFYGRLTKVISGSKTLLKYYFQYLPKINRLTEKYFPPNTPKIEEISRNTSLLLVNTLEPMVLSRPRVSNYVEIGGIHCRPAKDLPKLLKDFVDNAEPEGLIYISFGLSITADIPKKLINGFLNVFRKLPQKVVFTIGQKVENAPSNVLITQFCPQQDILGHPNTKLFITHGGIHSLIEAVFHEVPVLVLPLTLDQPENAVLAAKVGYGRYLRFSKFSEEAFYNEISELLSNKKYMKRVKDISVLTKDINLDTKQNLKWWINYIIRHRGYPMSKYNQHKFKHSNYYVDTDVFLFLLFVTLSVFVAFIFIVILTSSFVNRLMKVKTE